jgi:hypothetical protein
MSEMLPNQVRLLRPYLPDGTPVPTYEEYYKADKESKQTLAKMRALTEEAVVRAEEAESREQEQALARQQAEKQLQSEVEKRIQLEAELEQLRTLLASRSDER